MTITEQQPNSFRLPASIFKALCCVDWPGNSLNWVRGAGSASASLWAGRWAQLAGRLAEFCPNMDPDQGAGGYCWEAGESADWVEKGNLPGATTMVALLCCIPDTESFHFTRQCRVYSLWSTNRATNARSTLKSSSETTVESCVSSFWVLVFSERLPLRNNASHFSPSHTDCDLWHRSKEPSLVLLVLLAVQLCSAAGHGALWFRQTHHYSCFTSGLWCGGKERAADNGNRDKTLHRQWGGGGGYQ